ncbi:hypothetical protein QBC39DRAFT_84010 [Podospora conica]|nr:hypothetical protein QBC39DRAFT_84010 [Schizothecium conicum]
MMPRLRGLWLGGPCWGVISVFLGGRSLGRLPSGIWLRGYPLAVSESVRFQVSFQYSPPGKIRVGQLPARHAVARQSRETGKFRRGGVVGGREGAKSCVIRCI